MHLNLTRVILPEVDLTCFETFSLQKGRSTKEVNHKNYRSAVAKILTHCKRGKFAGTFTQRKVTCNLSCSVAELQWRPKHYEIAQFNI